MTLRVALVAVACVPMLLSSADAQQLADPSSRREALQFYRSGREFMSQERFDRAAEEFNKALGKDRLLTLAHYGLGQAHMSLRNYERAIEAFKGCLEASRALFSLAQSNQFLVERQRDDEIREMRETVRVLEMQASRSASRDGASALKAMQAEQHLRDLENQRSSLGERFRPPAEVLLSLGSAFFRSGNREAAEAQWKAAIDANAKLGEAHNNLAVIYMQTARFAEADEEIKLAEKNGFRVNPQFKEDLKKAKTGK